MKLELQRPDEIVRQVSSCQACVEDGKYIA